MEPDESLPPDTSGTDHPDRPESDGFEHVSEPAKLVRVMDMTRSLLEELQYDGLDQPARAAVNTNYREALRQIRDLLSEDDRRELNQLLGPLETPTTTKEGEPPPTGTELRLAEAQLLGWLEGLLRGMEANEAARQAGAQLKQATRLRRAQERHDEQTTGSEHHRYR